MSKKMRINGKVKEENEEKLKKGRRKIKNVREKRWKKKTRIFFFFFCFSLLGNHCTELFF